MTNYKMINLSDAEIDAYCRKFNLTRTRFLAEKGNLEQKKNSKGNSAYSEEQINRLIFRKSSKNTIATLLDLHDDLIKNELTPQQIYQLAAHDGGSKNLKTFIEQSQALQVNNQNWASLELNVGSVLRLLAHPGGSRNLKAYSEQIQALQAQNLSWASLNLKVEDVLRFLVHGGNANKLKAYIKHTQTLQAQKKSWASLDLQVEEVLRILANDGGSQALDTLLRSFNRLHHLGFTTRQLVTLAANKWGAQALAAVLKHTPQLLTQAYSLDFICTLAARTGGAKKIQQPKHNEPLMCRHDQVITAGSTQLTLTTTSTTGLDALLCDIDEDELSEYLHSFVTSEDNHDEDALLFGDKTFEEHEPFFAIEPDTINQITYDTDEKHEALLFGDNNVEYQKFFSDMELEAAASASTHSASPLFFSHKRKHPRESNAQEEERKKNKRDEVLEDPLNSVSLTFKTC
ncbi:hypothetical protein [Legionella sp. km772]|uniref:hypothetical protein n=1 Tax=Legionella sp. km772 TaxID=2498111 RepID=UPI000F8E2630|nr:hypothetical protein [Legionella sp. km772]RUR13353.1 hypothetical protein ELY15_02590 [Legionella sp. km772]